MDPDIIGGFPREGLPTRPRSMERIATLVLAGSASVSEGDGQGSGTKAQAVGQAEREFAKSGFLVGLRGLR